MGRLSGSIPSTYYRAWHTISVESMFLDLVIFVVDTEGNLGDVKTKDSNDKNFKESDQVFNKKDVKYFRAGHCFRIDG